MAPRTRAAAPKKGKGKKATKAQPKAKPAAVTKTTVRKKVTRRTNLHPKGASRNPLPTVEQVRASISPRGSTVAELIKHFGIAAEQREEMNRIFAHIQKFPFGEPPSMKFPFGDPTTGEAADDNDEATSVDTSFIEISSDSESISSSEPHSEQESEPEQTPTQGFRPVLDRLRQPSMAEITFGRPSVPRYFHPATATSPTSADRTPTGPGPSPLGRTPPTVPGAINSASPRRVDFGRMSSISGSPRSAKTPMTPQSPMSARPSQPIRITVEGATQAEADAALSRQQLVRESVFELKGLLGNLDWKIRQFEALVEKAERDVIWETVSSGGIFGGQGEGGLFGGQSSPKLGDGKGGLGSAKKLRFQIDSDV